MISLTPYIFIHIGLDIRLLRQAKTITVKTLIIEADTLIKNLSNAEFAVSVEGARKLQKFLETFRSSPDQDRNLTDGEVTNLHEIVDPLEYMVFAESQTKKIYVVSETRFNLNSLMNAPEKMLGKDVFAKLSPIAKLDLSESFKCLVFSRATAGAFHILRGTEAVLKMYYLQNIKRGRERTPMWANMTRALAAKRHKKASLLQKLDFIRENYRNPTSHPEAVYTVERLQDLIGLCIDVINEIAVDLLVHPS
jgi:hypothetical protein